MAGVGVARYGRFSQLFCRRIQAETEQYGRRREEEEVGRQQGRWRRAISGVAADTTFLRNLARAATLRNETDVFVQVNPTIWEANQGPSSQLTDMDVAAHESRCERLKPAVATNPLPAQRLVRGLTATSLGAWDDHRPPLFLLPGLERFKLGEKRSRWPTKDMPRMWQCAGSLESILDPRMCGQSMDMKVRSRYVGRHVSM